MVKKIPIGPFLPILEEPECFVLHVEGERVVKIDQTIGWSHRGIELLSERKTWDQVPFLVERICGICSCSHSTAGSGISESYWRAASSSRTTRSRPSCSSTSIVRNTPGQSSRPASKSAVSP